MSSHLVMHSIMTSTAKAHKVGTVIRTAVCQWYLVMHKISRNKSSFLCTPFAERVRFVINTAYTAPLFSIAFRCCSVSSIAVVFLCSQRLMFVTVRSVTKVRAASVSARGQWLSWHCNPPYKRKSPHTGIPVQRLSHILLIIS